jgi:hypothetical protein
MKKNNFLITGFGRSGTKFLSQILNMSPTYKVSHEATGKTKSRSLRTLNSSWFSKNFVGDVNSYHCLIGEEIYERNITDVFYTLRLPTDICFSLSKRYIDDKHLINYIEYTNQLVDHIEEFFFHVRDSLIDPSRLFFFEKFTQEETYLHSLCQAVGVTDISLSSISKKINIKVNASSEVVASLDEVFSPDNLKKIKEIDQIYYELFDRCFKTS